VNNEIKAFNRKLRKPLKVFDNTSLIQVSFETEHFTRHGLHLHSRGKEQSAKKTVNTIINIFKQEKVDSITMKWKEKHAMVRAKIHIPLANKNQSYGVGKLTQERRKAQTIVKKTGNCKEIVYRDRVMIPSKRSRRLPANKSDDFLWIGSNQK
jgi:hypothetical protein